MLVDDEQPFADALAFRLEARGLPCLVAYRGEDALDLLESRELEVVLLDLNMPGMHGLDVLRQIKSRRPDLEVLLLTAEADLALAATGMRRGAGDYLLKPVNLEALLESVAKARTRVREHRERLRAAEAVKLMSLGALAAGVGHEINNPLQIILQRSEWLQELLEGAPPGGPEHEEMVKSALVIQKQARRAGDIAAQLLALARQSREGAAQARPGETARRVAGLYAARARELGASIILDLEEDLPEAPCSDAELEPVLSHLVRNALDAIEAVQLPPSEDKAGGQGQRPRQVLVSVRKKDGRLRLQVQDTGEGVASEAAPYIYDPFFSTRPVGKGAGLGLTVCHSIVSALRGSIGHLPAPGGGTLFTVDMEAGGRADAASQQKAAAGNNKEPMTNP